MIKFLKRFIQYFLEKRGYRIVRLTSKEKVEKLITKLYPYETDKDLIRLGPKGDGGYLVPDDLEGIEACFSPGVNDVSGFEADCFDRGMRLFLADKSVLQPNRDLTSREYSFLKKYIGCTSNIDFITMDEWVRLSHVNSDTDLLLQMDIEGSEYFTFINMSDALMKRFRIIVVEFHDLEKLWNSVFYNLAEVIFSKILQNHTCVHIHPNNCCGIETRSGMEIPRTAEFTFIRNDRIRQKKYRTKFPHQLDFDNTSNAPIALPQNWYHHS